jgi:hypothetical protein
MAKCQAIADLVEPGRSKARPGAREVIEALDASLQKIYDETGMTEDEFADLMDPKIEFPWERFGERPDGDADRQSLGPRSLHFARSSLRSG